MAFIGLTGGIAAGKSTIGRRLAEHGAIRIDADQLARDAVAPGTEALSRIRDAFGSDVITAHGELDRQALGARVFGNPELLERLNGIVHPAVRKLAETRVDRARASAPDGVVVYEVPLLVESEIRLPFDVIVVAEAPDHVRRDRLVELRGLSAEEAERRIASQASNEERRAIADIVIDTGRTEAETLAATDALWEELASGRLPARAG